MKSCEKKWEKCKNSVVSGKLEHQCAPKLKVQIYTDSKKKVKQRTQCPKSSKEYEEPDELDNLCYEEPRELDELC